MAKFQGAIVVETDRCKGCALCVHACDRHVIELSEKINSITCHYAYMARPEDCIGCTNCAVICPDGYITVYRAKVEE